MCVPWLVASYSYYRDNISDGAAQNAQLGMKSAKKGQVGRREKEGKIRVRDEGVGGRCDSEIERVISE